MPILCATNIFYEIAQLVAESSEDFVFVLYRLCCL